MFAGAQSYVWNGRCRESKKEGTGTSLIKCLSINILLVLWRAEVPNLSEKMEVDATIIAKGD